MENALKLESDRLSNSAKLKLAWPWAGDITYATVLAQHPEILTELIKRSRLVLKNQ
jgi:hypothetical protein